MYSHLGMTGGFLGALLLSFALAPSGKVIRTLTDKEAGAVKASLVPQLEDRTCVTSAAAYWCEVSAGATSCQDCSGGFCSKCAGGGYFSVIRCVHWEDTCDLLSGGPNLEPCGTMWNGACTNTPCTTGSWNGCSPTSPTATQCGDIVRQSCEP
jgi:hypothetical protein